MHCNKLNFKWFIPLLLVLITPAININIGVSSIHIYMLLSLGFVLLAIYKPVTNFNKMHIIIISLLLISTVFSIFLLINGKDYSITNIGNNALSPEWQKLYGKGNFQDYYRSTTISLFQLVNFIILSSCFHYYYNIKVNYREYIKIMSFTLCIALVVQFIIVIFQFYFLKDNRPGGTFGNAQSLGFMMNIIIAWFISNYRKRITMRLLIIGISLFIIYLSGTRSALFISLVILIIYPLFKSNIRLRVVFLYSILFISIIFTILFSISLDFRETVLLFISYFTSPLTMNVRGLMWNSFSTIFPYTSLMGTFGITVYFTDNFFWFFCLPYGVLGIAFLIVFFHYLIKCSKNSLFIFFITTMIIFQSVSYYGFFVEALGWILMAIIALELKRLKIE